MKHRTALQLMLFFPINHISGENLSCYNLFSIIVYADEPMRISLLSSLTLLTLLLLPVSTFAKAADGSPSTHCNIPTQPGTPDGAKATMEDMIAAQQAMKSFLANGDVYLECLTSAEANFGPELTPEHRASLVASHNDMVEAMEGIASKFNEAVRAYKARQ